MKIHYTFITFSLCCISIITSCNTFKAIINVPVADLIGQPIHTTHATETPQAAYNQIPLCSNPINSMYGCPRLHQALYNDMVEVIKTTEDEAYIKIMQSYYLIPSSSVPQSQYWTLKKNITLIDDLLPHNIDPHHIPNPIAFSDTVDQNFSQENVITLIEPHYDPIVKITFSAGTRFIQVPSSKKKKSSATYVFAIDYQTYKEHQIKLPTHKCMVSCHTKSMPERITDYVHLLKKWCYLKQGSIPYTWGGTSFCYTVQGNFKESLHKTNSSDYSAYAYDKDTHCPKSGFDCSGVIARAAQICGIPYFCKNTSTIAQSLTPLHNQESLSAGDLILIKGHVMVITDISKNLLIEARSYSHGYGKLHEIALKDVFEEINTYQDLCDAYFNKKVIKRKDKNGKTRDTFTNLQLFSMASVIK